MSEKSKYRISHQPFLVENLLYKSKYPSVRMSTTFMGKCDFLGPYLRCRSNFFVQIYLMNEHLFCNYFVRLSVGNVTKGFATYGCFHPCFIFISIFQPLNNRYNILLFQDWILLIKYMIIWPFLDNLGLSESTNCAW